MTTSTLALLATLAAAGAALAWRLRAGFAAETARLGHHGAGDSVAGAAANDAAAADLVAVPRDALELLRADIEAARTEAGRAGITALEPPLWRAALSTTAMLRGRA